MKAVSDLNAQMDVKMDGLRDNIISEAMAIEKAFDSLRQTHTCESWCLKEKK